jgi:hypothetical protein
LYETGITKLSIKINYFKSLKLVAYVSEG